MTTFTKAEIADQVGIPASTAKGYFLIYKEFLPGVDVGKKHPEYNPIAVDIVRTISSILKEDKTKSRSEIKAILIEKNFKPVYEVEITDKGKVSSLAREDNSLQRPVSDATAATLLQQSAFIAEQSTRINQSIINQVKYQNELLETKDITIDELGKGIRVLQKQNTNLKATIEQERRLHRETKEKLSELENQPKRGLFGW